jgi:hypothetical protein
MRRLRVACLRNGCGRGRGAGLRGAGVRDAWVRVARSGDISLGRGAPRIGGRRPAGWAERQIGVGLTRRLPSRSLLRPASLRPASLQLSAARRGFLRHGPMRRSPTRRSPTRRSPTRRSPSRRSPVRLGVPLPAASAGLRQQAVQRIERILDSRGDCLSCPRQLPADTGSGVAHPAGCPADGAPLALRRLALNWRDLVRDRVPDVRCSATAAAESPADLPAYLLTHVLGTLADEPAVQIANQVGPGRGALPGPVCARPPPPRLPGTLPLGTLPVSTLPL